MKGVQLRSILRSARGGIAILLALHCQADLPAQIANGQGEDLARLQAMLGQPGADGREARETAVGRLVTMSIPAAHRILQQTLVLERDVDDLRGSILNALRQQLRALPAQQFGGAQADVRREIVTGYVAVLSRFWRKLGEEGDTADPIRSGARAVLQRLHPRELEESLRTLLAAGSQQDRVALLRTVADLQQTCLAPMLSEFVENEEREVGEAARTALRLLTFHDGEFATRAQFAEWYATHRDIPYVDLAERAARDAERRAARAREEQDRIRIDAAREFVRAHTSRKPGIDWTAIQARTLVDDPAVVDACLELLSQALAGGLPPDDSVLPRQAFCRSLLQRWRAVPGDQVRRRSLLLEVAACIARPEESELAGEIVGLLINQLDARTPEQQVAALRGLRRFPSVESRVRVVRFATEAMKRGPAGRQPLEAAIRTLASRTAPRWFAPGDADPDKGEWLALIQQLCRSAEWSELREVTLQLTLSLDARDQRLPEVFTILLDLAKDRNLDSKFRSTCLIHLQGWRDQQALAESWVAAMRALLDDQAPEVRQLAAESLARLTEVVDPRRSTWIAGTIVTLRDRMRTEPVPNVLRALVDCMQACGREPQMPEKAIGALNVVLGDLGSPIPQEHQFRLEPLLGALATIASDPRADRGQWLGACRFLEMFEKRQSLRLVLQNHAAIDLAKDVSSADGGTAERAREAMLWTIRTALLKAPKEPWTGSDELTREARDVRVAFGALDSLEESQRLDEPRHRLLRLEVELACGKFQDAAQRASGWLAGLTTTPAVPGGANRPGFDVDQRDRLRCLAAEAQLGLNKPDLAAKLLAERDGDHSNDSRSADLEARIARALQVDDPAAAATLFEHVLRATPVEDAQFRGRLLDWANARLRQDPSSRVTVLAEVERHAGLFDAQDCPAELRSAFQQLRGQR